MSNNAAKGPLAISGHPCWAISGKRLRATGGPGPLHCYVGWRCMVWRAPLAAVAAVSGPPVASIGQKRAEVCVICFC